MSLFKKYTWHKIAGSIAEIGFSPEGLAQMEAAGKKFCIAKQNNKLNACAHSCPHAGGIMAEGYLDPLGNIVCPVHRYKFSLQNGFNTTGEGYFLKTYPVEIREDGVYLGIEEKRSLFGW